jgi:hypothetical protein
VTSATLSRRGRGFPSPRPDVPVDTRIRSVTVDSDEVTRAAPLIAALFRAQRRQKGCFHTDHPAGFLQRIAPIRRTV